MTQTTTRIQPRARGRFAVKSMIRYARRMYPHPARGRWRKRFTGPATDRRLARLTNDWRGLNSQAAREVRV